MPWPIAFRVKALTASTTHRAGWRAGLSMTRLATLAILMAALAILPILRASPALATHPEHHCASYDRLVASLTGKPHYERRGLVLKDEMSGQGGQFELFANSGEGGRNSYTLIRTRPGSRLTCIVTAGLVGASYIDNFGRTHLLLRDENDPDTFDVITYEHLYVITRTFEDPDIAAYLLDRYEIEALIVSYGKILDDRRIYSIDFRP